LLAIYFFPKIVKFHTKRFWKDHPNPELARVECNNLHSTIDYYNLLEKCNQFTITERLMYSALTNVYKIRKFTSKYSIPALQTMFQPPNASCDRVTRQRNNCPILEHNTAIFENSVQYYSIMLWNGLPSSVKNLETENVSFKNFIIDWILKLRKESFTN
jgi:hypothetical protein